jgi:MFS family permease
MMHTASSADEVPELGIRENLGQFSLLVLINAFVGGMVGLERTIVPLLGSEEFRLASTFAITAFIVSFGVTKALVNLISGPLADLWSRKPLLILGWVVGVPVPFLIIWAPTWSWIVVANVLLGINQGFAWSMTVLMKIDLAGPSRRGLAMGLNESAGYGTVGLTALVTGYIAASSGLRPKPFYLGIGYAFAGLLLSAFVRETRGYVQHEARSASRDNADGPHENSEQPTFRNVFATTSWRNRTLFGVCQAGLVNNLNDGMAWGIFPLFFAAHGLAVADIGVIKAVYPFVWALGQLVTGPLSDRWGRKGLIVWGMWLQALAHPVIALGARVNVWASGVGGAMLLGLGTAMVYPSLLAAVSDVAHPVWRARSLSVYRFWRDLGYAVGAAIAGLVAGALDLAWSIHVAGLLTLISGVIAWMTVGETRRVQLGVSGVDASNPHHSDSRREMA